MPRRTPTTIITRDPQLRARLLSTLRRHPDVHVVESDATNGRYDIIATALDGAVNGESLDDPAALVGAHVALIGVEAIDADAMRLIRFHRRHKGRRVVVLAGQLDQESVCDALDAGATSFVRLAPATPDELVRAIGNAVRGESSVPPEMIPGVLRGLNRLERRQHDDPEDPSTLTEREVTVLRLLAEGWAVAEISREMSYSERTIKNIVHDITMRLGLRNRTHAVAFAVRCGLI
jgi:DNA-binding NarL/FixJ family response regulator